LAGEGVVGDGEFCGLQAFEFVAQSCGFFEFESLSRFILKRFRLFLLRTAYRL